MRSEVAPDGSKGPKASLITTIIALVVAALGGGCASNMQRMSPEATYALQEAQAACAPGGNKKQCAMTANALPIDHGADLCMRPNGNQACAQVQVECREGGDPEACQKALSKLTE